MHDFSRSNNSIAKEKYSKSATLAEEAVNTEITKIEIGIEPALYEDAPKAKRSKTTFLKNSGKK